MMPSDPISNLRRAVIVQSVCLAGLTIVCVSYVFVLIFARETFVEWNRLLQEIHEKVV